MRIKICGITREEDARLAGQLGADAIGLNFFPASPRYLEPARATAILREIPPFVEPVALFVNRTLDEIKTQLSEVGLIRTVQLHGDAGPTEKADPFRIIMAFQIRDQGSLREINQYLESCQEAGWQPSAVLVDAFVSGQFGGTGQTVPWRLLADYRPQVPLILAGGLTPDNVAEAIRTVRPYGVDVAGGVESAPGRKDPDKMRRFIDNARSV